jgi:hypothetical protein
MVKITRQNQTNLVNDDKYDKLFDGSDKKNLLSCRWQKVWQKLSSHVNDNEHCEKLPRRPTSDETYTLAAHLSTESDDIMPRYDGFQIMILWNNNNLRDGHNSCHWH